MTLSAQAVVWEPVTTTIDALDREVGNRIGPMYQKLSTKPWTKSGPALVARVGPTGESVAARVAFPLSAAPPADEAAALGLEVAELPAGPAAVYMMAGLRDRLGDGDAALDAWLATSGKKARGDLRWYVFLNRADEVGVDGLRTRIVQPIE